MKVKFSEPDQYGEIHANIEVQLNIKERSARFELEVNDNPAAKYHLAYHDAGTVGYARMQGQYAVNGTLCNESMDWAKDDPDKNFGIINAVGIVDNGTAKLHLWRRTK